jgi:hypothetical protein
VAIGRREIKESSGATSGEGARTSRALGATAERADLSASSSLLPTRRSASHGPVSCCRFRMSVILLHNPHFICRCLLPGEPTLSRKSHDDERVCEIWSSEVVTGVMRARLSGPGSCSDLAEARRRTKGPGSTQHGIRSENDLAARCAEGAGCPQATLSTAHCSSRTRWLGQIRKCRPWQSLA